MLMLFPGGLVLDDRAAIIDAMSGEPWSEWQMEDARVMPAYSALVSSLYVREAGGWRLAFHQQTPR